MMKGMMVLIILLVTASFVSAGALPDYFNYLGAGAVLTGGFPLTGFSPLISFETDILSVRATASINTDHWSRLSFTVAHRPVRDVQNDGFAEAGANILVAGSDGVTFTRIALYAGVSIVLNDLFSVYGGLYPVSLTIGDIDNTAIFDGGEIGLTYFIRK